MAITPVQQNIETPQRTYRDAKTPIKTNNLVHPLPAEGHLVHDTLLSIPKFWLKDIAYDVKCIRNGLRGTANDHQTGRLNDVGLKLGGIGIATYLASRTTDPKMRVMEYLGLGTFLASMSLYPKLAINAPSRVIQGFDIGKEYIDDQGRKKSVLQDPNYIPMDMYRGEYTDEDLQLIGDSMGIPRGIKNRNDLIKEQMRKIGIQNNTLWMLGAGFATPVMTALICCGLERVISPAMMSLRNSRYNSKISNALRLTQDMTLNISDIESNSLSRKVEKLLTEYKDKELPKEEFDKLIKILSDETDAKITDGIKEDISKMLKAEKNGFIIGSGLADDISNIIKETVVGRNAATEKEVFNLTKEEIEQALRNAVGADGKYMTQEQLYDFKGELKKLFGAKIEAQPTGKKALYMQQNNIIEEIANSIQKKPSSFVSENIIKDITDFAKVIGDFKEKDHIIDKCKSFKVEHAPETVLARYYKKFENTIFDILDIKYKDLKQMKESEALTKEIIEQKIEAFVKNEAQYEKGISKLAKVMSDMEVALHGKFEEESYIKDIITAYENNFNKTAQRIDRIGQGKFSRTINKLVKDNVNELSNTIESRQDMFDFIEGVRLPNDPEKTGNYGADAVAYAKKHSKGVGSSRDMRISRIIERIQGVRNTQQRLLHTLDFFKRETPVDGYQKDLNKKIKDVLLTATSSDHTLKLDTLHNPELYKDIFYVGWDRGIQDATSKAMGEGSIETGSIRDRFLSYMKRFRDVMGNNDIDFMQPEHLLNNSNEMGSKYTYESQTRMQKFNLVAQNPLDFFKKASKTRFENQKWLRIASAIGGTVLAGTILAQFAFGKVKNPHNIQKQVSDDKSI
jgi:hypothetical protein